MWTHPSALNGDMTLHCNSVKKRKPSSTSYRNPGQGWTDRDRRRFIWEIVVILMKKMLPWCFILVNICHSCYIISVGGLDWCLLMHNCFNVFLFLLIIRINIFLIFDILQKFFSYWIKHLFHNVNKLIDLM